MIILKIGGGEAINLEAIVEDIADLNEPMVIVHGANVLRDQVAEISNQFYGDDEW